MRLFEFEAKALFSLNGIPIPEGEVVETPTEARDVAESLQKPVMLKAQVLAGMRGKAGGIKLARNPVEAEEFSKKLLGTEICGCKVRKLLVEECLDIDRELYLSVTFDSSKGRPVIIASPEGGIEIEEVAFKSPEKIIQVYVDVFEGIKPEAAREIVMKMGLTGDLLLKVSQTLWTLYKVFEKYDAIIAEINPLIITKNQQVSAAGAVLNLDDDALYRHPEVAIKPEERIEDPIELEAWKLGIPYVRLDGDIGTIGSGAGLAIATIDLVRHFGGKAANFLDTGGRITQEHIEKALEIVMMNPNVRAILINLYGGINPIVEGARGIVKFIRERKLQIPVVVKVKGNFEDEAWKILEEAGVDVIKVTQTELAAQRIVQLAQMGESVDYSR
ncbi:ADP-forming succinate--CoA ligase subunit beta [Candidatus Bathyarchaeota archaeon]|nr:ADP-forming succinate--CoA ligase subunit beta [Candidatus Bathyarchaeota archaeon]